MIDPASVGIGAVAMTAIAAVVTVARMALKKPLNGNGKSPKSGELSPTEWELRIKEVTRTVMQAEVAAHLEKLRETIHSINDHLQTIASAAELLNVKMTELLGVVKKQ